ncbi:MAG TPA: methyltransferase domain-containing protein [Thermoanaerobaculia bacterium]|nr:methyltransferase domain-containing protein [Thermoanaerobaculia bacterium]
MDKAAATDGQALVFARNFFKNPKMLGSLIPSSRFLIKQLLRDVKWNDVRVFVEYGPGVGTISGEIVKRMRPDAKLIVFEINDDFVRVMKNRFQHDSRVHVLHRSAAEVQDALRELGLEKADCAIAGIPFSIMKEEDRQAVLRNTHAALRPGGSFLVYQFSSRVRADLEKIFGPVHQGFEPLNILPARLFHCVKV